MPPVSRFERLPTVGETTVTIHINGQPHAVDAGWTVAAALIARGHTQCRCNAAGQPRGPFCLTGLCFECLVEIDSTPNCQACQTTVTEGMNIVFNKQTRLLA